MIQGKKGGTKKSIAICKHLGEPTGETLTLEIVCKGCNGSLQKTTKEFTVHQCEIHGRCNPSYSCEKNALLETVIGDVKWAEPCRCEQFESKIPLVC